MITIKHFNYLWALLSMGVCLFVGIKDSFAHALIAVVALLAFLVIVNVINVINDI